MIQAFSEQLIIIDELRSRMPHLHAREANLRGQIDALDAQATDRDAYLQLAGNLEGFLAQLNSTAATASVPERQRVLRLFVTDILIGPEKITIRPASPPADTAPPAPDTTPKPIRKVTTAKVIHCAGGVVSPPMCNVYLHRLDRAWDDGDGALARSA
ncbi:MAG: hypothetical protein ACRDOK_29735 [Streptosporangiaceae bacterium]